jgi:type IV pilus assembly protein PilM
VIQLEEGLSDDEAEELVILEADKYIPYPIDEVNIDFQYIGPSSRGGELFDVLVVASRTENVNTRADLVRESGLDVSVVDVGSYAIERTCQLFKNNLVHEGKDTTFAVFDIGEIYTQLTVLHHMKTIFSREEVFGGKQLTDELVKRYDLSPEDARKAKSTGDLPDDYVEEVLEPFKDMVGLQIRRALQFFFSTNDITKVDQILLAGGSSLLPGLSEKVEEVLSIPTKLVDPTAGMSVAKGIDIQTISKDSSALMLACGLALRKFE